MKLSENETKAAPGLLSLEGPTGFTVIMCLFLFSIPADYRGSSVLPAVVETV